MKSIRNIHRAGFTLIELLIVIAIIALLASMAVPAANVVMRKAKEAQARALITGLIIGVKTYQTEYNRFPDPSGTATADAVVTLNGQGGNNNLILVLHPDQNSSAPTANPRRINFYDPPIAKSYANGLAPDNSLNDPWSSQKNPQNIMLAIDYSGDGTIDENLDPTQSATSNIQTPVIAWSTGQPQSPPNANNGSNPAQAKYFICSWK